MTPLRYGRSRTALTSKSAVDFTTSFSSSRSLMMCAGSLARWYRICVRVVEVVSLYLCICQSDFHSHGSLNGKK